MGRRTFSVAAVVADRLFLIAGEDEKHPRVCSSVDVAVVRGSHQCGGVPLPSTPIVVASAVTAMLSLFYCHQPPWEVADCLGAIDGTYIEVNVLDSYKPRYRTRKGNIAVNVLGVYNRDMNFVYVLAG
ncbi:unnamed protein product [Lactuca saligna]|uniref:Uncharacterized protein n=1 Tax=Lactuca saligna TaxID=75948 RepID=A0AA35Z5F0_LACSI|nr:unnamed protein product [Lactuca saligna]